MKCFHQSFYLRKESTQFSLIVQLGSAIMLNVQDKLLSLDFDLGSHGHQHHNHHHYITTIITITPSTSPTITITAIPHHDFLYTAIKETSSRLFSFIFMHSSFFTDFFTTLGARNPGQGGGGVLSLAQGELPD